MLSNRFVKMIDSPGDHIDRTPIEPELVEKWILDNHTDGDKWSAIELPPSTITYAYCICGHETPVHNCLVVNLNKKIGFIVGNRCVMKFSNKNIIKLEKTKKFCLSCGIPIPRCRKHLCTICEDAICTFGKYKGKNIIEIYYSDKSYCDWLLSEHFNFRTKGKAVENFVNKILELMSRNLTEEEKTNEINRLIEVGRKRYVTNLLNDKKE